MKSTTYSYPTGIEVAETNMSAFWNTEGTDGDGVFAVDGDGVDGNDNDDDDDEVNHAAS